MRISNINQFLSGADNVVSTQHTEGSARTWTISLTTGTAPNTVPVDLTGFTVQYDTQEATASVTAPETPRGGGAPTYTVTNFMVPTTNNDARSRDTLASITNPTMGQLSLYLPADLHRGPVAVDAADNASIVWGALRLIGTGTQPRIITVRTLIVVRASVIAS